MLTEQFYSTELVETLSNVLQCGNAGKLLQGLPEPWPEEVRPTPPQTQPPVTLLDTLTTVKPYGADNIPTLDGSDSLLASVRVRWRRPKALQRKDFELVFRCQARAVVTLEDVLARLRAGIFNTQADLARYYGKQPYWVSSLMYCCLREGLVEDMKTWQAYFPKKRPSLSRKVRSSNVCEPVSLTLGALAVATAVTGIIGQNQKRQDQKGYQNQLTQANQSQMDENRSIATTAYLDQAAQSNNNLAQEREAAAVAGQDQTTKRIQAQGAVNASGQRVGRWAEAIGQATDHPEGCQRL